MAAEEERLEGLYLERALEIVERLWSSHSAREIATAIHVKCRYYQANEKLVYALKARLDTAKRNRPQ